MNNRVAVSCATVFIALTFGLGAASAGAVVIDQADCLDTDALFEGTVASDCIGLLIGTPSGDVNPSETLLNNPLLEGAGPATIWALGAFGQNDWDFATKDEGGGGLFGFSVEDSPCAVDNICSWELTSGALTGEFLIAIKQAGLLNLYLFDAALGDGSITSGIFSILSFDNNIGWSNVSIYTRDGTIRIPEPGTLSLLGVSLLAVGLIRRRSRRKVT